MKSVRIQFRGQAQRYEREQTTRRLLSASNIANQTFDAAAQDAVKPIDGDLRGEPSSWCSSGRYFSIEDTSYLSAL